MTSRKHDMTIVNRNPKSNRKKNGRSKFETQWLARYHRPNTKIRGIKFEVNKLKKYGQERNKISNKPNEMKAIQNPFLPICQVTTDGLYQSKFCVPVHLFAKGRIKFPTINSFSKEALFFDHFYLYLVSEELELNRPFFKSSLRILERFH